MCRVEDAIDMKCADLLIFGDVKKNRSFSVHYSQGILIVKRTSSQKGIKDKNKLCWQLAVHILGEEI